MILILMLVEMNSLFSCSFAWDLVWLNHWSYSRRTKSEQKVHTEKYVHFQKLCAQSVHNVRTYKIVNSYAYEGKGNNNSKTKSKDHNSIFAVEIKFDW